MRKCQAVSSHNNDIWCQLTCQAVSSHNNDIWCQLTCQAVSSHNNDIWCQLTCQAVSSHNIDIWCQLTCQAVSSHNNDIWCQLTCQAVSSHNNQLLSFLMQYMQRGKMIITHVLSTSFCQIYKIKFVSFNHCSTKILNDESWNAVFTRDVNLSWRVSWHKITLHNSKMC
jgi:hypothetical protein